MKVSKVMLATIALICFSVSGWASDKMKADLTIYEPVHVGSSQLAPGDYKMTWTDSGSNAEVTFSQGKKVIATVPAQVTQARSGYDGPALHIDSVSGALTRVELPKLSFSFSSGNGAAANSGN